MMTGSVVFFAVLGVLLFSIGANDAYYIKSGLNDEGISSAGNEEAARMGESTFGTGESAGGGHYIRKRSPFGLNLVQNLGHDMATGRSTAGRRRSMSNSKRQFSRPTSLRAHEADSISGISPPFVVKSRPIPMTMNSLDSLYKRSQLIPGVTSKALDVISSLLPPSHILAKVLPKLSTRNSLAPNKNVYRSSRKYLRSNYPDSGTIWNLPLFPPFPAASMGEMLTEEILPFVQHEGLEVPSNIRAALDRGAENRFSITDYASRLWNKLHSLHGSSSAPIKDPVPPYSTGREDEITGGSPGIGGDDITGGSPGIGGDDITGGSPGIGGDDITGGSPGIGGDDITGESTVAGGDDVTGGNPNEGDEGNDYEEHHGQISHSNGEDRGYDDYGRHYARAYHPDWEARFSPSVDDSIGQVTSTIENTTGVIAHSDFLSFLQSILAAIGKQTHGQ